MNAQLRRPPLVLRLLVVLAGAVLIWLLMVWLSMNVFRTWPQPAAHTGRAVVVLGLAVLLVAIARRALDRRSWAGLWGTGQHGGWRAFVIGVVSWLVPGAVAIALAVSQDRIAIALDGSAGTLIRAVALLIVLVLVIEAVPEELVFRGYLYRNLAAAVPPWLAVVFQAVLFAAFGAAIWTYTAGWDVALGQVPMFLGLGVSLGVVRVATGNLWGSIGFYLAYLVTSQLLLGGDPVTLTAGDEDTLNRVALVPALIAGPIIALLLARPRASWARPQPDAASAGA